MNPTTQGKSEADGTDPETSGQCFLDGPEVVWNEPAVEQTIICAGNVRSYYYYGEGRQMRDSDMRAILGENDEKSRMSTVSAVDCAELRDWDSDLDGMQRPPYASESPTISTSTNLDKTTSETVYTSLPGGEGVLENMDAEFIRILEILPATPSTARTAVLELRLHVVSLKEATGTYEALSYTWQEHDYWSGKDMKQMYAIWLNGERWPCAPNLFTALMARRWADGKTSRFIWADALCVNQGNLGERSHQVRLMGEIFSRARQVVIWLGDDYSQVSGVWPTASEPRQAFAAICSIVNSWAERAGVDGQIPVAEYRHVDTAGSTSARGSESTSTSIDEAPSLASNSPIWKQVFALYRRRWFHRVWVIQEAALARRAVVLWGRYSIPWEWVGLAAAIIRTNYSRLTAAGPLQSKGNPQGLAAAWAAPERSVPTGVLNAYFLYRIGKSSHFYDPLKFSFHRLLTLSRRFDCQDDRDRVYGLIGLPTTDANRVARKIRPDYQLTTEQVYTQLTELIIDATKADDGSGGSLAVLSSVQRPEDSGARARFSWDCPSWVPQWPYLEAPSLSLPEEHPTIDVAAGRTMIQWQAATKLRRGLDGAEPRPEERRKTLIVRGVLLDRVSSSHVSEFKSFWRGVQRDAWSPVDADDANPLEAALAGTEGSTPITRQKLEHLAMTLTAGRNWYGLPVRDVEAHVADYAKCLLKEGLVWSLGPVAFGLADPEAYLRKLGFPQRMEKPNNLEEEDVCEDEDEDLCGGENDEKDIQKSSRAGRPRMLAFEKSMTLLRSLSEMRPQDAEKHASCEPLCRETLKQIAEGGNADRFLDACATAVEPRARFITSSGLYGIGPRAIEPGDQLCILYGARVPFIVRPFKKGFQLVGEAYVRDIMQGEALKLLENESRLAELETWIHLT